jgi:inner membrane transporter RhtA
MQSRYPSGPTHRLLPYAALAASITTFCVGTSFAKQLFPLVGAAGTSAYRVGFSALILLAVVRPWRFGLARTDAWRIVRYGLALGTMNLCFYMALRTLPLGPTIAIEFLGPLTVSLLHARRPVHVAMAGLAVAGLALLLPLRVGDRALDPVGIAFALAAAAGWGCYLVFGKRTGHLPAGQAVAFGMATAALLTPAWLGLGLVAALLSSAIPFSLEIVALKHIPAHSLGVLLSLEPAVGAVAGVVLLGETLTVAQWAAIAMVMAASIGMVATSERASGTIRVIDEEERNGHGC